MATNEIIYTCNVSKINAEKYINNYTDNGHPYYQALYEAHCKVVEIFNSETTYEARYEKLVKFVNNKARALKAKYKKTNNSEYFDAAYTIKYYFLEKCTKPFGGTN